MLPFFIAILLGLAAPAFTNSTDVNSPVIMSTSGDTEPDPDGEGDGGSDDSGDTGHIPPKPPTGG